MILIRHDPQMPIVQLLRAVTHLHDILHEFRGSGLNLLNWVNCSAKHVPVSWCYAVTVAGLCRFQETKP